MSQIMTGITIHGGLRAFGATFLVFVDYMRGSLRVAALTELPNIYVLTHDSFQVGEDGPTHQPNETIAGLRVIPNLAVLRPGDAEETTEAWKMAMSSTKTPVCLCLSRQDIVVYDKFDKDWKNTVKKGAYVVQEGTANPDITVLATGAEVGLALEASAKVSGKNIRVVSVMDKVLFENQDKSFQHQIIGGAKRVVVAEAGAHYGWEGFAKKEDCFCIDTFGTSGPAKDVAKYLKFTADDLAALLSK